MKGRNKVYIEWKNKRHWYYVRPKHSIKYVIKIIEECGYTTYEVIRQVMEYTGSIVYGLNPLEYLRRFNAKDIRKILKYKID